MIKYSQMNFKQEFPWQYFAIFLNFNCYSQQNTNFQILQPSFANQFLPVQVPYAFISDLIFTVSLSTQ